MRASLPKISRGRSAVHGDGVFAGEAITRNTRIIDYAEELIRNDAHCEAELLFRGCGQDDLDQGGTRDPARRRADLRLLDHRGPHHPVPMPSGLPEQDLAGSSLSPGYFAAIGTVAA